MNTIKTIIYCSILLLNPAEKSAALKRQRKIWSLRCCVSFHSEIIDKIPQVKFKSWSQQGLQILPLIFFSCHLKLGMETRIFYLNSLKQRHNKKSIRKKFVAP